MPKQAPLKSEIGLILKDSESEKVAVVMINVPSEVEDEIVNFLRKFRFDLEFSYKDYGSLTITSCIGTIIIDYLKHVARQHKIAFVYEGEEE